MPQAYNPIVRTFGRFRAGLVSSLDIARHEVRPGTQLEVVIPVRRRREVWRQLRRQGLRVPPLELPPPVVRRNAFLVVKTALGLAFSLKWPALLLALPLALAVGLGSRRWAVHFPCGLRTVGEMVLYLTSYREHRDSGYQWTRNEISIKVRLIIAESLGLSLDEVQPEHSFRDLGCA